MHRPASTIQRILHLGFFTCLLALAAVPAMGQDNTTTDQTTTSTTETTSTTSTFISDYGLWIALGVVLLVVIIVALTRGRGGDSTTVVK